MFETSDRASFLIILFRLLQYYIFVVLSGDVFALFHRHFYCDSFNRGEKCIPNLSLTAMQKQGLISVLLKTKNELSSLNNWRPLTLLNTHYKIITKTISNRIKRIYNKNHRAVTD